MDGSRVFFCWHHTGSTDRQTSFLLEERGGTDDVGYVSTGYFAGLTIGRVILIPITTMLGRHNAIYV